MKRNPRLPKSEWKSLSKRAKQERKTEQKKANWKCSGKKRCHGMRSSVAKTWDESKQTPADSVQPAEKPLLSPKAQAAIAARLEPLTGWPARWIIARGERQILVWAQKYL